MVIKGLIKPKVDNGVKALIDKGGEPAVGIAGILTEVIRSTATVGTTGAVRVEYVITGGKGGTTTTLGCVG
jgi:hypothetical protein